MEDTIRGVSKLFFELFEDAPRQGPGSTDATAKALALCGDLPAMPAICDMGCGAGAQTLDLARLTGGLITAVDNHQPFLDRLSKKVRDAGLATSIRPLLADMGAVALPEESLDLIWSEGAIYNIGLENGLRIWRKLLRPGGRVALSHLVWFSPDAPEACRAYFKELVPDMTGVQECLDAANAAGFEVTASFSLPVDCWTTQFYQPLEKGLALMRGKYPKDPEMTALSETMAKEIAIYREYSAYYGYEFLILRRKD